MDKQTPPEVAAYLARLGQATSVLRTMADDEALPEWLRGACEGALDELGGALVRELPDMELSDHLTI